MRVVRHVLRTLHSARASIGRAVRTKPIISIALSLAAVAAVALFVGFQVWPHAARSPITAILTNDPPKERRAIDGVWVEQGKDLANPPLVSVIIENARDAQPLAGVDKASLVYESLVEATITRFMAVIPMPSDLTRTEDPIGPVRSVRPYFVTWTSELGALLAHVGGSPAALEGIRAKGLLTLNEYSNGTYFHRDRTRYAPHNTYTTTAALADAVKDKLIGTSLEQWSQSLPAWQFKDDTREADRSTTAVIRVGYAEPYAVTWEYTKESNDYTRQQWGGPHAMADGTVLTAKNIAVIVQRMAILDEIGRKEFTTEGEGTAYLFRDGTAITGTWQKDSPSARMRLFDGAGAEMQFNAGTTWIEIVPITAKITY